MATRGVSIEGVLRAAGLFALTFALAYFSLHLPRMAGQLSPIWFPNALVLAALLLTPRLAWPELLTAGLAGILAGHFAAGSPPLRAFGLTACNGLELILGASLMRRYIGPQGDQPLMRTILRYDGLAAIQAAFGATLASLFLCLAYGTPVMGPLFTWGTADFAGLITVTPSLIALAQRWRTWQRIDARSLWPLLLLAVVATAVFSQSRFPYSYLVAASLLLVSFRLGLTGAAFGLLIALVAAVTGTLTGHGPFYATGTTLTERMLSVQLFIAVSFHLSVPVALQRQRNQELQAARDQALVEAQIAEAKYRQITEAVQDIIVQTDRDARIIYASPSIRALGHDPADLIGRPVFELAHPDEAERMAGTRNLFFAGHDPSPGTMFNLRIKTAQGDYRWLESRPHMIRDEDGNGIALEAVMRDVTDSLAAEEALKASEARYRLLSEHMSDIVARYGSDGVIRYASPSVQSALGYTPEEMVGQPIGRLLAPEDRERVKAEFVAHRQKGPTAETFRVEFRMFRKDGSVAWLEAHPRAIFDEQTGEFFEWQDVVREIGERKALEAELTSAKEQAEAAANAKAEFLANMSHELRTPLTGVLGFAKLASAAYGLAEPARTYVRRVDEASKALLALLNDILDYSKLEAGDVRFRPEPVAISELARASMGLFEAEADGKGIHLEIVDRLPAGLLLELDANRMRQVLLNLIGNAVKFTEQGAVTLRLRFEKAAGMLSVSVSDTGPGIAAERLPELFKRFSQVHDGRRRYGGTGLGLAICRSVLEAQGGRIGVSSKLGEGSSFHFKLPTHAVNAAPSTVDTRRREKVAVLVADDSSDLRDLMVLFLKDIADVSVTSDGRTAIRMAGTTHYDVMLLDVRMPGLGGPPALQRIRAGSGPNVATPAIALTADHGAEAAERLRRQGFSAVIPKPFSSAELVSAIAELLRPEPDAQPEPLRPQPGARPRPHLVI